MWALYLALVVLSGSTIAFPQTDNGFVFDGPVSRPSTTMRSSTAADPMVTTTSTSAPTTTATPDPQLQACIRTCPTTPEYNPVCGTDRVTYDNPGLMSCAAFCGKDVTRSYYGPCTSSPARG
ncbi:four-domain proteases inhibitor-like [Hylaeus anthracinus]|uniref:four-domain proteases inhibitor-like n=1 Tax=Hylaeus anthracinus TaxID=313031 RepID=UPI0023B97111|nr:four-domain proteases inhibitor-like [Hylaeus anthracinus]